MEFNIEDLGEEGRGVRIETQDDNTLVLSVGFIGSHAGYAPLTRSQALFISGALSAMASGLEDEEQPKE